MRKLEVSTAKKEGDASEGWGKMATHIRSLSLLVERSMNVIFIRARQAAGKRSAS